MSQIPVGDLVSATCWRQHGRNKDYVAELLKLFCFQIEPSLSVHPLPQQLNWRLSPKFFFLWHIQIVDKNYHTFLALFGPVKSFFPSCGYSSFNLSLNLVGLRLTRKGSAQISNLGIKVIVLQFVHDVDSFPCSSWS